MKIREWFDEYTRFFLTHYPEMRDPLAIKAAHCRRVARESVLIGEMENFDERRLRFAELVGLLHDVGRYEQLVRYHTFSDRRSENHSKLAVDALTEHDVLAALDDGVGDLVCRVIMNHNQIAIPENAIGDELDFSRLLRDADKLDIWKVVTDHYQTDDTDNSTIGLDLPDDEEISPEVCYYLLSGELVPMQVLRSLNDFKLLQMGWVYDVNFTQTLRFLKEREYLEKIRDVLPDTEAVEQVYMKVRAYIKTRI